MFLSDVGTMSMMMMLALTVLSVVGRVTLLKFGLRLCWECVAMMIKVMVLLQSLMQNWPHHVLLQSIYTTKILRFRNRVLETPTNMCYMCTQLIHLNTKSSVKWAHEFIIRVMWWICDSNALHPGPLYGWQEHICWHILAVSLFDSSLPGYFCCLPFYDWLTFYHGMRPGAGYLHFDG